MECMRGIDLIPAFGLLLLQYSLKGPAVHASCFMAETSEIEYGGCKVNP